MNNPISCLFNIPQHLFILFYIHIYTQKANLIDSTLVFTNMCETELYMKKNNLRNILSTVFPKLEEGKGKGGQKTEHQLKGLSCQMVGCSYFSALLLFMVSFQHTAKVDPLA